MKNADAIARFDELYIMGLRQELEPHLEPEYQNLEALLEAGLRSCKLCSRADDQGSMVQFGSHWTHVDCAHEYSQSCAVDPTTQHIDESDEDYDVRMIRDFPHL
jgi:hypothetical protein